MKNKKIMTFIILSILFISAVFIYLYFQINKESQADLVVAQGDGYVASLDLGSTSSIPLNSKKENQLRVTTESSSSYPTSMSSSQFTNNNQNTGSNSSPEFSSPSSENFKQFEKYKDSQDALFADLVKGNGSEVLAGQTVSVKYKGWLTSGQLFDQSINQPFVFKVGEGKVIGGFEQLTIGMKVGGLRRMVIPPSLGYGPEGYGPIPANSVLVFDVQLDEVK